MKHRIADKINELRQKQGLSQEELAERAGLGLRTIQRIEAGHSIPRGETLRRLAGALGMEAEYISGCNGDEVKKYAVWMTLSALAFLVSPIFGIIMPAILWVARRGDDAMIDDCGMDLLNFQITWFMILFLISFVEPAAAVTETKTATDIGFDVTIKKSVYWNWSLSGLNTSIFKVMGLYIVRTAWNLYNIVFIVMNVIRINSGREPKFFPVIRFIK